MNCTYWNYVTLIAVNTTLEIKVITEINKKQ